MLRLAYIQFMRELYADAAKDIGAPLQIKIHVQIGIREESQRDKANEYQKKLSEIMQFNEETLKI